MSVVSVGASAESKVKLTNVHNCCKSCTKGIEQAVTKSGATAAVDKTTVTITAADDAAAKKAVDGLVAAGHFGEGASDAQTPSDAKAKSVTVEGVHLCCGKCVDGFNKAVKAVAGVTGTNAAKNATSVTIEGDVSPKAVLEGLHKAGFGGTVK